MLLFVSFINAQTKKNNSESINFVKQQCEICNNSFEKKEIYIDSEDSINLFFHNYHVAVLKNDSGRIIFFEKLLLAKLISSSSSLEPYFYFLKGKLFLNKNVYSEAISAFETALKNKPNIILKGYIFSNTAFAYQEQKKFKLALASLEKAQDAFEKLENNKELKSISKNKALCYLHLKVYDKSEKIYKEIIQIEKKLKDTLGLAVTTMDLANLYYAQYRDAEAIPLFKKALQLAKTAKNPETLKTAYRNMSVVEENLKHYKASLSYLKKYRKIQDSITKGDRVWELAEKQKDFELKEKQKEIIILEKDQQIKAADIKIKNQQRNLFITLAISLFLITIVIAFFYKNNIRKKRLIQEQRNDLNDLNNLKDELFSVLAHDLRSHVSNLMFISDELETAHTNKNNEDIKTLITQNDASTNKTFQLLDNLLHWVMVQSKRMFFQKENIKLLGLIEQMELTYSSALNIKNINFNINIPIELDAFFDMNSLKIILRNLIDNAIKFTPNNGVITVKGYLKETGNVLTIKDSGVGMTKEQLIALNASFIEASKDTSGRKSTGLGLRLCNSFLKRNDGKMIIDSSKESGTTFQIIFPKTTML